MMKKVISTGVVSEEEEECSVQLSCSIDETNKLRKKLGLAPLRLEKSPKIHVQDTVATSVEEEANDDDGIGFKVREKLLKEGAHTQLGNEEDLNLLNWISRSRALDAQKKSKKGLLLNLTEEEEDDKNESGAHKDEDANYMDLRIAHNISSFHNLKPGCDIVLTLEDSKLLNSKGQLEAGNGFLQNENILRDERKKLNCRNRLYNPIDSNTTDHEDQVSSMKNSNGILSLYDEWGETDGGLSSSSSFKKNVTESYPKLSEISETKQCVKEDRPYISLESKTSIQRDFMNEQEVAQYQLQSQKSHTKSILAQRNECLLKMMKRKRRKHTMLTKEEAQEDTEATFLSPLLRNTKNLPIVLGSDDVDLENTFLYAQLSRQLPKLSQTIEMTNQTKACKKLSASQSCRTRDPAHSVFENVKQCEKKQRDFKSEDQEGEVTMQQEGKVEYSDITEFCRTLETPFEKMASFKKESTSPCHLPAMYQEDPLSPELSTCKMDEKDHSSDVSHIGMQNDISEKDKAIVQNVLVEEVLDGGLVSALNFLKSRGDLEQDMHRKRKKNENVLLHMSTNPNDIKLEYKDEYGRVMTPKEAFRYISWVFHGKGPGKKKREKFLKKMEIEKKMKGVLSNPSQLLTMRALRKQQKTGQAHIVLSRKT